MTGQTEPAPGGARGLQPGELPDTRRVRFLLAGLVGTCYFGLVGVMAFRPAWLGAGREGVLVSTGMLASLLMILLVFLVMSLFVWWLGGPGKTHGK